MWYVELYVFEGLRNFYNLPDGDLVSIMDSDLIFNGTIGPLLGGLRAGNFEKFKAL